MKFYPQHKMVSFQAWRDIQKKEPFIVLSLKFKNPIPLTEKNKEVIWHFAFSDRSLEKWVKCKGVAKSDRTDSNHSLWTRNAVQKGKMLL